VGISLLETTTELQWAEAWVELSKDVRSACPVGMLGDGFHSDLPPVSAYPKLNFHSACRISFPVIEVHIVVEVEDWEIPLGCHVRRRSHYVHEKISAVGRRSQSLNAHKVSCCGSKCKSTRRRNVYPEAHGGHPARSLLDPHRLANRNVQDQGNDSRPPLCQYPFGPAPLLH
jgi:hypothetical protein